ncbi:MAG: GxxExxY protein [Anaerolineales bacterium]|nr:GxxExxY protein [Anaerolineae bacterium]PWB53479.1 MAG: GxxExxY protein [Anaerolineales bacterium]
MNEERDELTEKILGCAFKVSNTLGCGFLEKVNENALMIELKTAGMNCEQQKSIPVAYQGILVGEYYADILVEGQVILEIKAAKAIDDSYQAQLINYLKATGIHRGLILNFGTTRLGIKRMVY